MNRAGTRIPGVLVARGGSLCHGVRRGAFVIAVWSYPIWRPGFAIAAWIAYARRRDRLSGVLTFLPVLVLIVILALSSFLFTPGM